MCRPPTRTVTAGLLTLCFSLILLEVVAERISLTPGTPGATPELPAALPSTTAVAPDEIEAGLPLLSVVLEPVDLYDPVTGIHANPKGRGRLWERPGFVSYFDDTELQFAGGVGVRIHGDSSRTYSARQSYRLYFRDSLGADQFGPGVLFNGTADPIRRLVLHNDQRPHDLAARHLVNPLAYTIAQRVGARVPLTNCGWTPCRCRRCSSSRGVPGRTATWNRSTGNSATNCSTARFSTR